MPDEPDLMAELDDADLIILSEEPDVAEEPYRILITGSRTWTDWRTFAGALLAYPLQACVIVHGNNPKGADHFADIFAAEHGVKVEHYNANWDAHGRAAGYRRNAEMVKAGADVCLAFVMPCRLASCDRADPHGTHGASHCADLAEAAGIKTVRFSDA